MRQALSQPYFYHRSRGEARLASWLRDFITGWRRDYAFARNMEHEIGSRPPTMTEVEQARDAVRLAFADIRSPLFHLDDLPVLQRNAPVHARRKIMVVRRDKGCQLRRADDLR